MTRDQDQAQAAYDEALYREEAPTGSCPQLYARLRALRAEGERPRPKGALLEVEEI